jgi:hypothetical protein
MARRGGVTSQRIQSRLRGNAALPSMKPIRGNSRQKSGSALIWSAATRRRFPMTRHIASFQSADISAHSKSGCCQNLAGFVIRLSQKKPLQIFCAVL